jgi:D-alanyl-lipoteichoic acid acyltransferase DltB (MBOAT superfamily)
MGYLVYGSVAAIAIVLFIFTGIWGGLVWIVLAGIVLAVVFLGRARTVQTSRVEPSGTPRASHGGAETANERVGQP